MLDAYETEIKRWRERRAASLTGPDGWLSVVGLTWLHEGGNRIGGDPAGEVALPGGPRFLGTIDVRGTTAVARFVVGAGVNRDGLPVQTIVLEDDRDGHPTVLRMGSMRFELIRRQDRLGLRVRDAESPARSAFGGIDHYPIDRAWRKEARFEPSVTPRVVNVPTVLDVEETYPVPGTLAFESGGVTHRLAAFIEAGETDLFIVFGDRTNGSETYGGGRYLYASRPDDRGMVAVDFNKAYNPPCVFTPHATCALPLPENRLPIRVEAGEKAYRGPRRTL